MKLFHLYFSVVERKPLQTLAHQENPLEAGAGPVAVVLEDTTYSNILRTQAQLYPHFCGVRPPRRGPLFRRCVRVSDNLFAGRWDRTRGGGRCRKRVCVTCVGVCSSLFLRCRGPLLSKLADKRRSLPNRQRVGRESYKRYRANRLTCDIVLPRTEKYSARRALEISVTARRTRAGTDLSTVATPKRVREKNLHHRVRAKEFGRPFLPYRFLFMLEHSRLVRVL